MNSSMTLADVDAKVTLMAADYHDQLIQTKEISFLSLQQVEIAQQPYRLQTIAQKGIATRLAVPFEYLNRCPLDVQAYNLNFWIQQEKNAQMFFRFDGNAVRAIFTPRYKPVNHDEILTKLTELDYDRNTQVQCYLDQELMVLSLPDNHNSFSLGGDKITAGLSIVNSEVGISALKISAFYLRLKCTNGLIAKTKISAAYRHISQKILGEMPLVFQSVSQQLEQNKHQFRLSQESKVDDPLETINSFNRQFLVSKAEQAAVTWGYEFEPGYTMFSIINAYTRGAEYSGLTAESSYKLQKIGGDILGLMQ